MRSADQGDGYQKPSGPPNQGVADHAAQTSQDAENAHGSLPVGAATKYFML
jgi:hypothetical protein